MSILIEYFKSCTILFSAIFIICYTLLNVAAAGTSAWLSDWSDKSGGATDGIDKYGRLGVYTALGVSQCNKF